MFVFNIINFTFHSSVYDQMWFNLSRHLELFNDSNKNEANSHIFFRSVLFYGKYIKEIKFSLSKNTFF